ncbi:MAG: hypothetical protein KA293_13555 [Bacteroidia bacterium]|nr:hypothetical protein [Bacteroidia bacterium]
MNALPLFGQHAIQMRMSAAEFSAQNPGILPDAMEFSKQLAFQDSMNAIQGAWSIGFFKNRLGEAQFHGQNAPGNKAEFDAWVKSAGAVVAEYSELFGPPSEQWKGPQEYVERPSDYDLTNGERVVFHEAVWVTSGMRIRLNCDFGKQHSAEKPEYHPNGPSLRSSYEFSIVYARVPTKMEPKPIEGCRFWLGMHVQDFAKEFPELFPDGVQWAGQWQHDATENGLPGKWTFNFDEGKLTFAGFSHYDGEVSANSIQGCMNAAEQMIDSLQNVYGAPDEYYSKEIMYRGMEEMEANMLRMCEAKWRNANGMKIRVDCRQLRGKSEPQLTLSVDYSEK